mmetsp:Transcript_801/g.1426  ORF Transcript_801/g.1426 Transcript_801/m.1426 type:complete len:127 (-) Transcript_801:105-485(-)
MKGEVDAARLIEVEGASEEEANGKMEHELANFEKIDFQREGRVSRGESAAQGPSPAELELLDAIFKKKIGRGQKQTRKFPTQSSLSNNFTKQDSQASQISQGILIESEPLASYGMQGREALGSQSN